MPAINQADIHSVANALDVFQKSADIFIRRAEIDLQPIVEHEGGQIHQPGALREIVAIDFCIEPAGAWGCNFQIAFETEPAAKQVD